MLLRPRLRVDSAIRTRLEPGTLAELRDTLRPVDCQTCGRPFGRWEAAALAIEAVDEDAVVSLHHRRCRPPAWQEVETPDQLRRLPHQTWWARLLLVDALGRDHLIFLVNPSYEVGRLIRDAGRWRVSTLDLFGYYGLGQELLDSVTFLPSLSAVVDTDRLTVNVTARGTLVERWDLAGTSISSEVTRILAAKDWLTIAVTTALDMRKPEHGNPMPALLSTRQVRSGAAAVRYTEAAQRLQASDFTGQDRSAELLAFALEAVRRKTGITDDRTVMLAAVACCDGDSGLITQLPPEDRMRAAALVAVLYRGVHVMASDPAAAAAYHELFSSMSEITSSSVALLTHEPASEDILAEYGADIVIGTPEQFLATHQQHRQNAGDWGPEETRAHLALAAGADVRRRAGDLITRYPRVALI